MPDNSETSLPPHSDEAEKAVLGAILLDESGYAFDRACQLLGNEEKFFTLNHRLIWLAVAGLRTEGKPIAVLTAIQRLSDTGNLAGVGGPAFVSGLPDIAGVSTQLAYWADIVREKWSVRALLHTMGGVRDSLLGAGGVVKNVIETLRTRLDEIALASVDPTSAPEYLKKPDEFDELTRPYFFRTEKEEPGILLPIDFKFRVRPKELTIVSGDDGSGKSTFLSFILGHLAQEGMKVCVASMEMPPEKQMWCLGAQLIGTKRLPETAWGVSQYGKLLAYINTRFTFYAFLGIANWHHLLDSFRYAAAHLGCNCFLIDSAMRIGIADDEYATQGIAGAAFAQFAMESKSHVFLVIHENKGDNKGKAKIRGSKLWSANADNIISIVRNDEKGSKIDELKYEIFDATRAGDNVEALEKRLLEAQLRWDTQAILRKQRFPGSQQNSAKFFYFDPESFQFRNQHSDAPVDWLKRWARGSAQPEEQNGNED